MEAVVSQQRHKRKAPDYTNGKFTAYNTVKCYMSGLILPGDDDSSPSSWKEKVREAFERRCEAVSKMMVRGSILLRLVVEELLLANYASWPDLSKDNLYVQLLRKGSDVRKLKDGSTHPALETVWNSSLAQETIAK